MLRANVHSVKAHLSSYLKRVEQGEVVVICRRNVPVAEIRSIAKEPSEPHPIGLAKGEFEIPEAFFEPLPADLLAAFNFADEPEDSPGGSAER